MSDAYIPIVAAVLFAVLGFNPADAQQPVWELVDSVYGVRYWDIDCADSRTCLLVGSRPDARGMARVTSDGGFTWRDVWPPVGSEHIRPLAVACPTPASWFVGADSGYVDRTTDAGATWKRLRLPSQNAILAIASADSLHLLVHQSPRIVSKTSDGGDTWEDLVLPDSFSTRSIWNIHHPDAATIIVRGSNSESALLASSVDTGRTWSMGSASNMLYSSTFLDAATGWEVGRIPTTGDYARDFVRRTTDGGVTWDTQLDSLQPWSYGLTALAMTPDGYGIAVGTAGKTMETLDSGNSWLRIRETPDDYPFRMLVDVCVPERGLAYSMTTFGAIFRHRAAATSAEEPVLEQSCLALSAARVDRELRLHVEAAFDDDISISVYAYNGRRIGWRSAWNPRCDGAMVLQLSGARATQPLFVVARSRCGTTIAKVGSASFVD